MFEQRFLLRVLGVGCIFAGVSHGASASSPYTQIRVVPSALQMDNGRDRRMLVVSALNRNGFWEDVTSRVTISKSDLVKLGPDHMFLPTRSGAGSLTVTIGGLQANVPVKVKSVALPPVSFVREVMPLLARTGCNAGTCHGAAKGKNGFKLSLRGYDPDFDYHQLTDDISGRRFNRARPEESLMLQKPVQEVPHQGGLVFEENSRFYPILKQWIAEGVKFDGGKVTRANRIEVLPNKPKLSLPGVKQQLVVIAHFPDGSTRDVTQDSVFTSSMSEVATVTLDGLVSATRRGESSVLVRYEGNYAANEVTVIGDRTGWTWQPQPQLNAIDKYVDAKLKAIKSAPSPLCTDEDFVRRIWLDLTGMPPSVSDLRTFLADKSPKKRSALIDRLLESPDFVENQTNKWADLLQVNRKFLGESGAWRERNWIREQIAANRPYDKFVKDILTSVGSAAENPAAGYFRVAREPNQLTENVTQTFLGIRFSCNKCHDHPFERWTQTQYYQFAANFSRVGFKPGSVAGDETVVELNSGEVVHPRLNKTMTAGYPYPVAADVRKGGNRRDALAAWMTSPKNPLFAKSYVNRLWSYLLGRGIIDPVDDIRSSNPPVNPELLDALTAEFVRTGFDVRQLIRTICNSRTYQASINPNRWNIDDLTNFSHAIPRRLTAEQLVDSLAQATGSRPRFAGAPAGFRAVELLDPSAASGGFLDLFGRPTRDSVCECERTSTVSLGQTLNMINSATINDSVADPNGRIADMVRRKLSSEDMLEELFLSVLCRRPTISERKKFSVGLQVSDLDAEAYAKEKTTDRSKLTLDEARAVLRGLAAQDVMWALLNSPAFLFNR